MNYQALLLCYILIPCSSVFASATIDVSSDKETTLKSWKIKQNEMQLELIQRTPDQTKSFYIARGFTPKIANDIANGCIFQTIMQNTGTDKTAKTIDVSLKDWEIRHKDSIQPIKLKEDWDREWPENSITAAARLAFRWATFPTEQRFEPAGDYNWGMTSFGLPPGSTFDLHIIWNNANEQQDIWINNMECPKNVPDE
jgi:hypothetical protein